MWWLSVSQCMWWVLGKVGPSCQPRQNRPLIFQCPICLDPITVLGKCCGGCLFASPCGGCCQATSDKTALATPTALSIRDMPAITISYSYFWKYCSWYNFLPNSKFFPKIIKKFQKSIFFLKKFQKSKTKSTIQNFSKKKRLCFFLNFFSFSLNLYALRVYSKVYLSKVYLCKMYLSCMYSKLCEFIHH